MRINILIRYRRILQENWFNDDILLEKFANLIPVYYETKKNKVIFESIGIIVICYCSAI